MGLLRWQEELLRRSRGGASTSASLSASSLASTDAVFCELMESSRLKDESRHASFRVIPRFCVGPGRTKRLSTLLRTAAERRCEVPVLSWEELEGLRVELLSLEDNDVSYETLCRCRAQRRRRRDVFGSQLSARRFLELPRDASGRASARDLYHRVDRTTCAAKTRAALRKYANPATERAASSSGGATLREADLERYVYDLIPDMPAAFRMDENFQPFYVFTAVRRFMFFLDPRRRGYVRADDAAASQVALDLLEIFAAENGGGPLVKNSSSWFFPETAKRVYGDYLELDVDHNGMLSKSEFLAFRGPRGDTRLTRAFVDRVFAEIITYPAVDPQTGRVEAEMDFKTYLDVVLAFDNVDQPQALSYFWRLLDVQKAGALEPFAINFFFRDVTARLKEEGFEPPSTDDVVDEIFDMVKPSNPTRLTFDDLLRCKQAHTVILMLVDVQGFLAYDNREHLIQGPDNDDDF